MNDTLEVKVSCTNCGMVFEDVRGSVGHECMMLEDAHIVAIAVNAFFDMVSVAGQLGAYYAMFCNFGADYADMVLDDYNALVLRQH